MKVKFPSFLIKQSLPIYFIIPSLFLVLSGCSYKEPYAGTVDESRSFKTEGFIGAGSQAIMGKGEPKKNKWAPLKGPIPPACSNEKISDDTLEALTNLEPTLRKVGIDVKMSDSKIRLQLPGNLFYDADSPHLNPAFYPILDQLIDAFKESINTRIDLIGHSDNSGPGMYNQHLSELRATHVQRYVISRGINMNRTHSYGAGDTQPMASNNTDEGRNWNRRVTLLACAIKKGSLPTAKEMEESQKRKSLWHSDP
ncbi:MAG: OmpA family protein [Pseudomonadota bacterium]